MVRRLAALAPDLFFFLTVILLVALPAAAADRLAERIRLPEGFRAEVWARVPNARSLAVVPHLNAVLVGSRSGSVHAVPFDPVTGAAGRVERLRGGLKMPNGIAWRDGFLYVAEQHRLVRFRGSDLDALRHGAPEVLFDGLPDRRHHGWRYARFGPDGALYVSVGAPCNVCRVRGLEGTILRFDAARAWQPEIFARGVRNSVGFDWSPSTGTLWFTDNGSDGLGDDIPPDELNEAPRPGLHFGFPWFGGGAVRTPEFADTTPPAPTSPAVAFNAHVAALGLRFYRGTLFPEAYRGDAFVAQHGSWNRTVPDGYRVMRVRFDESGRPAGTEVFADGFLRDGRAWGRPVDVAELPDGSLLISDDRQEVIYRITWASP